MRLVYSWFTYCKSSGHNTLDGGDGRRLTGFTERLLVRAISTAAPHPECYIALYRDTQLT